MIEYDDTLFDDVSDVGGAADVEGAAIGSITAIHLLQQAVDRLADTCTGPRYRAPAVLLAVCDLVGKITDELYQLPSSSAGKRSPDASRAWARVYSPEIALAARRIAQMFTGSELGRHLFNESLNDL